MPFPRLVSASRELLSRLRQRSFGYWVRLLLTIIIVKFLVNWADEKGFVTQYRYEFYALLQKTKPNKATDQDTVVISIDDDEYWKGKPQGRAPIKRDYLASLIERLDAAEAKVIAVDFDLRSPTPDGNPVESPDYAVETAKLLDTVKNVSIRRPVVLAKTIWRDHSEYVVNSDIYEGYDFGQRSAVFKGYIALPYNRLKVPLTQKLKGGVPLDSFSMAIVRACRPKALERLPQTDDALYGSFIGSDDFDRKSAHEVLIEDMRALRQAVSGHIAIIGGAWSSWAYGVGSPTDLHETPMGWMPGVYIQANYVEAILDGRTYPPLGETAVKVIEWLVIAAMAIAFATAEKPIAKAAVVVVSWLALGLLSYVSFINLGIVFDLFVPALSVTVHWALEHVWEGFQRRSANS